MATPSPEAADLSAKWKAVTSATNSDILKTAGGRLEQPGEIRLLELLPYNGSYRPDKSIRARIFKANLSEKPLFAAVSYVWGPKVENDDYDRFIELDDELFFGVSCQLFDVLKKLFRRSQSRVIWVDAICIDQNDIQERNLQVMMMGEIFSAANHVNAQLKCGDDALYFIKNFDGKSLRHVEHRYDLMSVQRFFSNQYWTRRWIVQELALARMVTFYCDRQTISLQSVNQFLTNCQNYQFPNTRFSKTVARRICEYRARGYNSDLCTLRDLLMAYEETACSDPLDKIFALLSLSPKFKRHLAVDYATSRVKLFAQVLEISLKYDDLNSSNIVGFCTLLRATLDLNAEDTLRIPNEISFTDIEVCVYQYVVDSTQAFTPRQEEMVQNRRAYLPRLLNFGTFRFVPVQNSITGPIRVRLEQNEYSHQVLNGISGQDLYAFTCSLKFWFKGMKERYTVGLATVQLDTKHVILQFKKAPVALVARESQGECEVVGRAFLLQSGPSEIESISLQTFHRSTQASIILEDTIDCSGESKIGVPYYMRLTPSELMQIVKWTSLDDRAGHLQTMLDDNPTGFS